MLLPLASARLAAVSKVAATLPTILDPSRRETVKSSMSSTSYRAQRELGTSSTVYALMFIVLVAEPQSHVQVVTANEPSQCERAGRRHNA